MAIVKELDKKYIVCHRPRYSQKCRVKEGKDLGKDFRDWWWVKYSPRGYSTGSLYIGQISFPKELIGKRVKIIIEEIEEKK